MTGDGLRGRVALVTGASSGLGRATAAALAEAGAQVIVHGRDAARLAEVAGAVGGVAVPGDLAVPAEVERVAAAALDVAARIDVLVCNAGAGWAGPFEAMPAADGDRLVAVNLAAPIGLTRLLLPQMRRRGGGRLVYVTSIAGRLGVAGEAVYAATKAGLDAFAESLRQELRGSGVTVGVLVPGVVDTPFFVRRGAPYTRGRPRPLPPDRVAGALVRGIAAGSPEIYVPGWLRLPVAVRGLAPAVYRTLAGRFGERVTPADPR
ncbi:Short-chain dehydrogenase [Thermomonospora echinospora]|uniref:Short-chain dehydrogenase n=1 Tax=Thermomonospora echinospora TaxID=1992 RepID=A0A1H5ZXT8_9ACTN|nr:SDR family NAD(P)-dependent oxidoreductase [Thermomonospora echinospora]SEG41021.1 Short-chain dehydrogenase [Thermomonospora echinospora]